jgi:hypothetical protein
MAKCQQRGAPARGDECADGKRHRRQRQRNGLRNAEPHQAARYRHADEEGRDHGEVEARLRPAAFGQGYGEQDGVAGHLAGKGAMLQKADGIGVAGDHDQHAGLQHGRKQAQTLAGHFHRCSHSRHCAEFIDRSLTLGTNLPAIPSTFNGTAPVWILRPR